MTREEISQGYPVVNGFPKYVTIYSSRLYYHSEWKEYYCPDGAWSLTAEYNQDRHLVVSQNNQWLLRNQIGKYLQPITFEQYQELGKCV